MPLRKLTAKEKYSIFFTLLKYRIRCVLKPPTVDYELPSNIISVYSKLLLRICRLMTTVGAEVPNAGAKIIVSRELLKWLAHERPDLLNDMIHDVEIINQ